MSLEQKLEALTAAVDALTATIQKAGSATVIPVTKDPVPPKSPPKEVKAAPAKEAPATGGGDGPSPGATLDDVNKSINALVKGGEREVALKILKAFGAEKKTSELEPRFYEHVIRTIEKHNADKAGQAPAPDDDGSLV